MKWILVVMVLGAAPVKTDLVFSILDECLDAEEAMRGEYARAYNKWLQWAQSNKEKARYPESEKHQQRRIGMLNAGTCVPHR